MVLLLFVIGLEFSLKSLMAIKKTVFVGGSVQVFLTIAVTALAFYFTGQALSSSIFMGFLFALSSTAIVLKLLQESGAINTPHGKISLAMTARPDVQQGEYRLARLEAQLGQRRSSYYPQVRTFASRSAQESDNGRIGEDEFAGTVGVNVTYNLFAGGRNRAAVAEARHQLEEAEFLLEELRIGAAADIRESAIELQTAQEALALQRTTAEFVTTNRDLVEKEYEAGQGSLARLNQAQRDLVEAEARLALARVALYSAWHALQTATGETITAFEGYITPGSSGEE